MIGSMPRWMTASYSDAFVLEVVVQAGLVLETGVGGDLAHRNPGVAVLGEAFLRNVENQIPRRRRLTRLVPAP